MDSVIALAICISLAWALLFALKGPPLLGVLGYLLVAACFGHAFWHAHVGPLPLTLDRLVLVALMGLFFVQRFFRRSEHKQLVGSDWVLFSLLAWLTLTTFTHDFLLVLEPPNHVPPLWRLAGGYLFPAVIYWLARESPLNKQSISICLGVLCVFGMYLAVTGGLEIIHAWSLVFPRHIADPEVGIHFGRARGPMVTAVSYGLCLAVCLLALVTFARSRGQAQKLLLLPVGLLFLAGIYFSYTRSVWIGIALALVLLAYLALRGRMRVAVLGLAVMSAVLFSLTALDSVVSLERETSAAETRDSTTMRASFTYVSWKMFLDRPIWGCGFGHFPRIKLFYLADRSVDLNLSGISDLTHHNTFLSLLTETGVIGFVLYAGLLLSWGRDAWRLRNSITAPRWAAYFADFTLAAMTVYVCQALFHELTYAPLDNSVMFFLGGIVVGLRIKFAPSLVNERSLAFGLVAPSRLRSAYAS